jgi:PDZ domain-containing protein
LNLLKLSVRLTIIALLIAVTAYFIPTSYILRAPGHADDLSRIVHVQGGDASHPGHLFMTTVIYEKANLLFCFYSMFDRYAMLVPSEETPMRRVAMPPPIHEPVFIGSAEDMMEHSKNVAAIVALRKLGYDIKFESTGVRVIGFLDRNVPAASMLHERDVIDALDGTRVRTVAQLRETLKNKKPGDLVTVRIRRDGKSLTVKFPLTQHQGHTLIGIMSQDNVEHGKLPVDVHITTHNVNGASAGLMFTLEIIDQLTPGGITRGHNIAGTGTIELDGGVGPIEGTELKEVAARRAGATVFLVPEENYADVRDRLPGMNVISVRTLDDALRAIKSLP